VPLSIFVDTSALLALLNADENRHQDVAAVWRELIENERQLLVTSYVIVETIALLQSRVGMDAVRAFHEDLRPSLSVDWVDEALHERAAAALVVANRRRLSLVDCVSFECMRRRAIEEALTLDAHFIEQGFRCRP
jgi:predicted nucleic acid-binding protein